MALPASASRCSLQTCMQESRHGSAGTSPTASLQLDCALTGKGVQTTSDGITVLLYY